MKLNALPLTNEIILWWDQAPEAGAHPEYCLRQGDRTVCTGSVTHGRLEGLRPGEEVTCSLWLDGRLAAEGAFRTLREARVLDVRDFGAVGDGVTMNREAIQRAFDACGEDEEVWFPAGGFTAACGCGSIPAPSCGGRTARRTICPRFPAVLKERKWNAIRAC